MIIVTDGTEWDQASLKQVSGDALKENSTACLLYNTTISLGNPFNSLVCGGNIN